MARTPRGRRLTEAHRLAQARLGAATVRDLGTVWPLLDPADLDGTFDRWLRAVSPVVGRQRAASTTLAANYLAQLRAAELAGDIKPFPAIRARPVPTDQLAASMLVTGPASIRSSLARGVPFERAVDTAQANTSRAGMRHALGGGRETVLETVKADKRAGGWARATSGDPCAFCAMLASRGPVYSEDTVDFQSHDGCSCQAEPVYGDPDDRSQWPPGAEEYRDLWDEVAAGPPEEARRRFRAALNEGRRPQVARPTPVAPPTPKVPAGAFQSKSTGAVFEPVGSAPASKVALEGKAAKSAELKATLDQLEELHGVPSGLREVRTAMGGKTSGLGGKYGPQGIPPKRPSRRRYAGNPEGWDRAVERYNEAVSDRTPTIRINTRQGRVDDQPLSFAHEFGHHLDINGGRVSESRFIQASRSGVLHADPLDEDSPERRFLAAVRGTDAYRDLARGSTPVSYTRAPEELWARAYSQWVLSQSDDDVFRSGIKLWRDQAPGFQWADDEFAEKVAPYVEEVLESWGLIRRVQ